MSDRELIALGTSSQIPTRYRNHNAYFLRWDDECFLFDPGEGTQRQMLYAGLAASSINHILISHFHGDHCLGLAGMIQRISLDRCEHAVSVHYPATGQLYFERLRYASIYYEALSLEPRPVSGKGLVLIHETSKYKLFAHPLDHGVPTYGYRLEELPGRRFLPEKLAAFGIKGPMVGELSKAGSLEVDGKTVTVDDVSVHKAGAVFAFVMDTRACPGTVELAKDADLLLMEATYTAVDQALATDHGHCSSVDAASCAKEAGVKQLALTHFSQRYLDVETHLAEAKAIFPNTIALQDLQRVTIPRRK